MQEFATLCTKVQDFAYKKLANKLSNFDLTLWQR